METVGRGSEREEGRDQEVREAEEVWATPVGATSRKARGRPRKAEQWIKERASSDGSLDRWKRKREGQGGGEEEGSETEGVERERKRMERREGTTQGEENTRESRGGAWDKGEERRADMEEKGIREQMEKMNRTMERVLRVVAGLKEEVRTSSEGLRKELEEGRRETRREIEGLRTEMERMKSRCEAAEGAIKQWENKWRTKEEGERREEEERKNREEAERARNEEWRKRIDRRTEGQRGGEEERQRIRILEWEMERKEKRERRCNVIIRGQELNERKGPKEEAEEILSWVAGGKVKALEVVKISGKGRVLLAKMESWEDKRKVMERKGVLKGKKIYIEDDLTKREREIQGKIWERARQEREKGKRTKVGYKKLWIGEKIWEWCERRGELVNPEEGAEEEQEGGGGGRDTQGGSRRAD